METKVKLRIDTRQAKSELNSLVRESKSSASKVAAGIRSTVGKGLGAVGFGAAAGTGMAAVRGATQSGVGDVVGEALGGIGAQVAEFFLGDLDEKSRASKSAREETIQAFGAIAGARGEIPPAAREFFTNVRSLRLQEEKGRELFERDDKFRGPGIGDMVDRIMGKLGELVADAVQSLKDWINPLK